MYVNYADLAAMFKKIDAFMRQNKWSKDAALKRVFINMSRKNINYKAFSNDAWLSVSDHLYGACTCYKTFCVCYDDIQFSIDHAALKAFLDIVKKVKPAPSKVYLQIDTDAKKLVVSAGDITANLFVYDIGDAYDVITDSYLVHFDCKHVCWTLSPTDTALHKAMQFVGHAQSDQETRYYLKGINFHDCGNAVYCVATDGHRLAKCEIESDTHMQLIKAQTDMIVSSAHVKILMDYIKPSKNVVKRIEILNAGKHISFSCDNWNIGFKSVAPSYVLYDKVIPDDVTAYIPAPTMPKVKNGIIRFIDGYAELYIDQERHNPTTRVKLSSDILTGAVNADYYNQAISVMAYPHIMFNSDKSIFKIVDMQSKQDHVAVIMAMRF